MGKTLYVRSFNESLHDDLNEISKKEGVSPGAIIEEALEQWKQKKEKIPKKHHLVLWSDEKELNNFLKKMDEVTKENWLQLYTAPQTKKSQRFFESHGWNKAAKNNSNFEKNPEKYYEEASKTLKENPKHKQAFLIGVGKPDSIKDANQVEKLYNKKRIEGATLCCYDTKSFSNTDFRDVCELFEEHDRIFVLKDGETLELNMSKQNPLKMLL